MLKQKGFWILYFQMMVIYITVFLIMSFIFSNPLVWIDLLFLAVWCIFGTIVSANYSNGRKWLDTSKL